MNISLSAGARMLLQDAVTERSQNVFLETAAYRHLTDFSPLNAMGFSGPRSVPHLHPILSMTAW